MQEIYFLPKELTQELKIKSVAISDTKTQLRK